MKVIGNEEANKRHINEAMMVVTNAPKKPVLKNYA